MTSRHPSRFAASTDVGWPTIWLFTDERMAGCPIAAAHALPPRAGIVFRHYATPKAERQRLFRRLLRVVRARRHILLVGGGQILGADGVHGSVHYGLHANARPVSIGVHDVREVALAHRPGARIAFISPVFATRSHIGSRPIGVAGFAALAARFPGRCIALGGMSAKRFRTLRYHGAHGWGAVDALSDTLKRGS